MLLDRFFGLFGVLLFVGEIGDHAVRSFHGVEDGNGASDPGVAACDDGFLALQLAGCTVGLVAAICGNSLGQHYTFRGSTGIPRQCFWAPERLEQRYNGLGKYEPSVGISLLTGSGPFMSLCRLGWLVS